MCNPTPESLGVEGLLTRDTPGEGWLNPQLQRVLGGWRDACGLGGFPLEPWTAKTPDGKPDDMHAEMERYKDLKKLLNPSWLLSLPDPAFVFDMFENALEFAFSDNGKAYGKAAYEMLTQNGGDDGEEEEDDGAEEEEEEGRRRRRRRRSTR